MSTLKDFWRRLWAPRPAPDTSDVSEESPAQARGVSLAGVAVAVLTAFAACVLAGLIAGLALRSVLPPHFVLAVFPLAAGAAALLSSGVWRTGEENLDRHLGLSFRGDRRQVARQAYADLWQEGDGSALG